MSHRFREGQAAGMNATQAALLGHPGGISLPGVGEGISPPDIGDDVKLPLSIQPIGGGQGILVDADGIPVVGEDGLPILRSVPAAPTGGSAPSFASTQAAQTQAEAFARAQADRDAAIAAQAAVDRRRFDEEQNRLDIEARTEAARLAEEGALKRNRLGVLSDLIQGFVSSQAQARDTLANLQPDPFRFAAVAGGIAPFGTTPQQGFTEQLQQFAGAPVPTADPNASLPSIQSAIQGLTGANVPLSPQVFGGQVSGLAGGGTVPAPFDVMTARLVGERGPEVMVTSPQGVTILPLSKGAQEGGFFPFKPIEFDRESLLPALGTSGIFGSLGFNEIPRVPSVTPGVAQRIAGTSPVGPLGSLNRLGILPRLIKFTDSKTIFFRGDDGLLHPISDLETFREAGFRGGDVVLAGPTSRDPAKIGDPFTSRDIGATVDQPSPFTKFSAPIIEPTTGTLLPAPFTVASELNRLRLTNPTAFNLLLSAYESAGVPATAVLSGVEASLPFGQTRTTIGLR